MKSITLERYKRAGRSQVAVGRFTFHVQRPTPYEMLRAREDGGFGLDFVAAHVVGWEGVKESDLIPSGDPEPLEFDAARLGGPLARCRTIWPRPTPRPRESRPLGTGQ